MRQTAALSSHRIRLSMAELNPPKSCNGLKKSFDCRAIDCNWPCQLWRFQNAVKPVYHLSKLFIILRQPVNQLLIWQCMHINLFFYHMQTAQGACIESVWTMVAGGWGRIPLRPGGISQNVTRNITSKLRWGGIGERNVRLHLIAPNAGSERQEGSVRWSVFSHLLQHDDDWFITGILLQHWWVLMLIYGCFLHT